MPSLAEALRHKPAPPPQIIAQRSEVELQLLCPARARFQADGEVQDADANRMRDIGVAFHEVMKDYIQELVDARQAHDTPSLKALAAAAPAKYQPDILLLADLTGPRVRVRHMDYISHETQYAYVLPKYGPAGEDVALTCCPDMVTRGRQPNSLWLPDWKTGYLREGFDFQAMFSAVVMWRSLQDIEHVTWHPFFCRFGSWGPRFEFDEAQLAEAEIIVQQAIMDYLTENEWLPTPGERRCGWCPYTEKCDADRRFGDIGKSPEQFALATLKVEAELKDRVKAQKAWVHGHGSIVVDGQWYGETHLTEKVVCRWRKGEPPTGGNGTDEK